MKIIFLVFVLIFGFVQSQDLDDVSPSADSSLDNQLVVFRNNSKCPMYTDYCELNILVRTNAVENFDIAMLESTDSLIFTINSTEKCETSIANNNTCLLPDEFKADYSLYIIKIIPGRFGTANIIFSAANKQVKHMVIITEPRRIIDLIFDVYVWVFQVVVSILMGCLLDWETLLKILKMPFPVLIGLCSQFILMPLLAFAFVNLFHLLPAEALALFIYGCSPGGAASNNWTILFDGDIDLSAIMTFISTITAFVAMPVWIYTLGSKLTSNANIQIPYIMLLVNIFVTVGPCLLGFLVSHFNPKVKVFATKIAKVFTLAFLITFFCLVLTTKYYTFYMMKWTHWIAGPLIPWTGYVVGGLGALLFCQSFKRAKTISIETGLQNVGVAFLIVMTNFPSPEKELAYLPLIAVSVLTIAPLYFVLGLLNLVKGVKFLINKLKKTNTNDASTGPESVKMMPDEA